MDAGREDRGGREDRREEKHTKMVRDERQITACLQTNNVQHAEYCPVRKG